MFDVKRYERDSTIDDDARSVDDARARMIVRYERDV